MGSGLYMYMCEFSSKKENFCIFKCLGELKSYLEFLSLQVKDSGIPMHGRLIHYLDGTTSFIPYGKKGQV